MKRLCHCFVFIIYVFCLVHYDKRYNDLETYICSVQNSNVTSEHYHPFAALTIDHVSINTIIVHSLSSFASVFFLSGEVKIPFNESESLAIHQSISMPVTKRIIILC